MFTFKKGLIYSLFFMVVLVGWSRISYAQYYTVQSGDSYPILHTCMYDSDCPATTGNPCSTYFCNAEKYRCEIRSLADGTSCDDGNKCNGIDVCQSGTCVVGTPVVVPENNVCATYACDPATGNVNETLIPDTPPVAVGECQMRVCYPGTGWITTLDMSKHHQSCGVLPGSCYEQGICQSTGLCSDPVLKPGFCFINGACFVGGAANPSNACQVCDATTPGSWVTVPDCCQVGTAQACYNGPLGTKGVGACEAGTQICGGDGKYGVCEGQNLPMTEVCDGIDNDCDGVVDNNVAGSGYACALECGTGKMVCDPESKKFVCQGASTQLGQECSVGKDNCLVTGHYVCSEDKQRVICDAKPMDLFGADPSVCSPHENVSKIFDTKNIETFPLPLKNITVAAAVGPIWIGFGYDSNSAPWLISIDMLMGQGANIRTAKFSDEHFAPTNILGIKLSATSNAFLFRDAQNIYITTNVAPENKVIIPAKIDLGRDVKEIIDLSTGENMLIVAASINVPVSMSVTAPATVADNNDVAGKAEEMATMQTTTTQIPEDVVVEKPAESLNTVVQSPSLEMVPLTEVKYGIFVIKWKNADDIGSSEVTFHEVNLTLDGAKLGIIGDKYVAWILGGSMQKCSIDEWSCSEMVLNAGVDEVIASYRVVSNGVTLPEGAKLSMKDISKQGWKGIFVGKKDSTVWLEKGSSVVLPNTEILNGGTELQVTSVPAFVKASVVEGVGQIPQLESSRSVISIFEPDQGNLTAEPPVFNIEFVYGPAIRLYRVVGNRLNLVAASEESLFGAADKIRKGVLIDPRFLAAVQTGRGGPDLAVVYTQLSPDGTSAPIVVVYPNFNQPPDVNISVVRNSLYAIGVDPDGDALTYKWSCKDSMGDDCAEILDKLEGQVVVLKVEPGMVNFSINVMLKGVLKPKEITWPIMVTVTATDSQGLTGTDAISISEDGITKIEKPKVIPEKAVPEKVAIEEKQESPPAEVAEINGSWEIQGGCSLIKNTNDRSIGIMFIFLVLTSVLLWSTKWWMMHKERCRVRGSRCREKKA